MSNRYKKVLLIFISTFIINHLQAQRIIIQANVRGNDDAMPMVGLMVVNKTTGLGFVSPQDQFFSVSADKSDTIMVTASGYSVKKICFKDSAMRDTFFVSVIVEKPFVSLKPVTIIPPRELEVIQKDIDKLGYKKEDYMVSGIDVLQNPITFLYQQFSRRERNKRVIAQKINDDNRRKLLKELFRKYVDNDIMSLDESQFDAFIDYINVSDEFLKNSSQYDFIMYVKRKYEIYKNLRP
ncbi:MAG: hypothetical protein JSS90_00850 [Bacteroidetes bacterium]|jgi:hypothetical protein|nr:hypothetical protein [Bacteroidota bacterium]